MSKLISWLTAIMVAALSCVSFALSYSALRNLALSSGAVHPSLSWAWPLVVDGAMIVFSLTILRASLYGERTWMQWFLVASFSALSVGMNVIHAPSNIVAWIVAGVAPIALLLSFESLMSQIRTTVKRHGVAQTLDVMTHAVDMARAELAELERQADAMTHDNSRDAAESPVMSPMSNDNAASKVGRAEFVTTYKNNGHTSIAELARQLGVDVRTAQRWIKADA